MRLGISTVGIADGPSGARSRLEGLLPELLALDASLEAVLYLARGARAPVLPPGPRVTVVWTPLRPRRRLRRAFARGFWRRRLAADGVDAFLTDYHPVVPACPTLLTIHDVRALEGFGPPLRRWWFRNVLPASVRRAAGILVPTHFVESAVIRSCGAPSDRVRVVPNGVGAPFTPDGPRESMEGPFVLHVGPDVPRKNLQTLRLSPVPVLLAGRPPLRREPPFRPIGPVSRSRLPRLMRSALAVVAPGRAEGFGMTALEAMACGVPVLAADAGGLPEVVGDAGIVLSPGDPEAWRDAIAGLRDHPAERESRGARGVERAAGYSWTVAAERLRDALYAIAS